MTQRLLSEAPRVAFRKDLPQSSLSAGKEVVGRKAPSFRRNTGKSWSDSSLPFADAGLGIKSSKLSKRQEKRPAHERASERANERASERTYVRMSE